MGLVPTRKEKLKEEWEKIKSLKGKKLWEYLWEYYKILIIGIVILLTIIGSTVYRSVINPHPTTILNVAWFYELQHMEYYDDLADELTNRLVEPHKNERVHVSSFTETLDPQLNMGMQARFIAMLSIGDIDIVIATEDELKRFVSEGVLLDIRTWLPTGTEGLFMTIGDDGVPNVYAVSIANSRVLNNVPDFITYENSTPYLGVFVNTGREEKVRQAIALFLE